MKDNRASNLISALLSILILIVIAGAAYYIVQSVQKSAQQAVAPFQQMNSGLQTQVSQLLHPTPTVIPDPVTYISQVRALARLETIQYSVEQVVTVETNQENLPWLIGNKMLLQVHGAVIAGIDMAKIKPDDMRLENGVLMVTLPSPEIFVTNIDPSKTEAFDVQRGLFFSPDSNQVLEGLEGAEQKITQAAIEDGILELAQQNAETYLAKFFAALGYENTIFESSAAD
jgi:hypothetical protein